MQLADFIDATELGQPHADHWRELLRGGADGATSSRGRSAPAGSLRFASASAVRRATD